MERDIGAAAALANPVSPKVFSKGAQRLIAGWSSPVARQAHNLKVASSNLAPATKTTKGPRNPRDCRGLVHGKASFT
jgi:hypothetical protein